ncbi:hypothetical protein CFC21_085460 [Triticum aestivum]|uniref:Myb/SANT-like domain-containing protein n=2 Tax=Triticum aestivum TaxID=4565 RepID=A0A3B6NXQ7_WHEAT|nr:hypothetical protein CFC21_085460 [Triticum aestivum]
MMTARGSPRLSLLKKAIERDRASPPTSSVTKRMRGSPKEDRAQWNASLEKDLVDLLREHDTPEHKGQNGWSSEAWNTIVKKFHQKNPYARTKQVEDERNKPRVVNEYSIKNCIDLLKTMEITLEEEVKAFRVFKIPENREIFVSAGPETALMWLRAEME